MFEIFLFVNPIGIYCYDTEILIQKAVDELNINTCLHFVPITNPKVIKEDIIRRKKNCQQMGNISQYTMASYQALRNYHAIKFEYGNKKARSFLVNMQRAVSKNFSHYSPDLPEKIAQKLNLDYSQITNPGISNYIEDSIQLDKNLARQFNVHNIPTTIIFNDTDNYNGILVEGAVAHDKLIALFKSEGCTQKEEYYPAKRLRLI